MRAFYKGVTPPLVGTGFINSMLFGLMGYGEHANTHTCARNEATDRCNQQSE
jgi:hypothetical protein